MHEHKRSRIMRSNCGILGDSAATIAPSISPCIDISHRWRFDAESSPDV
jgi:hypothetical protein